MDLLLSTPKLQINPQRVDAPGKLDSFQAKRIAAWLGRFAFIQDLTGKSKCIAGAPPEGRRLRPISRLLLNATHRMPICPGTGENAGIKVVKREAP